ncbi:MAG: hypothetical protein KBB56_08545 [Acidobacteria bacterium]|nr:hypothetical protein [Acidobacteriota bacterium]
MTVRSAGDITRRRRWGRRPFRAFATGTRRRRDAGAKLTACVLARHARQRHVGR